LRLPIFVGNKPQNLKQSTMKKVFAIFAIAGVMVACNNSSEKKADDVKDTAAKMMDDANKMVDTAASKMDKMVDTAASKMNSMVDTAAKKMEEAKPKM
jgi:ketopantoate reductase